MFSACGPPLPIWSNTSAICSLAGSLRNDSVALPTKVAYLARSGEPVLVAVLMSVRIVLNAFAAVKPSAPERWKAVAMPSTAPSPIPAVRATGAMFCAKLTTPEPGTPARLDSVSRLLA